MPDNSQLYPYIILEVKGHNNGCIYMRVCTSIVQSWSKRLYNQIPDSRKRAKCFGERVLQGAVYALHGYYHAFTCYVLLLPTCYTPALYIKTECIWYEVRLII